MEKANFGNGIHSASSDAREVFYIHEPSTGKSTLVREANDEQLAKAFAQAQRDNQALVAEFAQAAVKLSGIAGMCGALAFEIDRRRRGGLVIP